MAVIDQDKRLSDSILWEIQRHYFLRNGMAAWQRDEVPHAISCSPLMARTYARIVFGYLRDLQRSGVLPDRQQPIYIVELGAGTGRLTYHFLHLFYSDFLDSPFAEWPIRFVLTDFVPQTLAFWQAHPQLQGWVAAGLLDYALFDATDPQPLKLTESGATISAETHTNPIILFANYFFDSIPHDCFVVEDGKLHDLLLTINSQQPESNLSDPTIWERMTFDFDVADGATGYAAPHYNDMLRDYAAQLPDDTVLTFPTTGLDCIRFWQQFDHVLLLSADRGHTELASLVTAALPLPNLHGSFSLMVNYHAISTFVARSGGTVLQAPHYQDNLQIVAYMWGTDASETALAFKQAVAEGGPDDWFAVQSVLAGQPGSLSLPQLLSLLRLSAWDAELFRTLNAALLRAAVAEAPVWNDDVQAALAQIWGQYLAISADDDLESRIEQLLGTIDDWENFSVENA